ncbi:hypothetical protein QO010_001885 [Caulobacter ginsengisoli]|uniref:DUF4440 domain-containing protein n=1 Tax=Caulobacter ginsengisoli TaxID=400775 RepID=A0ABU0ISV4_9CAUL|nr:nuclear transport factor 2 family protein [Caulobacter ginsengisoli]MDQ0464114.1 hypothetical protein [Caulobacter ginsengisoli]
MISRLGRAMAAALMLCVLGVCGPVFAGPDEEALAKIEYDFANMQITKDPATIERMAGIMDAGFRFTDPARRDWGASKEQVLMTIRSDKLVIASTDFRPFTIRIFGSTAIVEGVNSSTGAFDGRDISGTFAWVDVFEKRDGRWIWLFSQSGFIGDKLSDKEACDAACPGLQPGFSLKK